METGPQVIVLAGPNGAGKSTAAAELLPPVMPFVNADEVAKTLPGYPSRAADVQAGREVLKRLDELERLRADFAVETTLAGRSLAHRIERLRSSGVSVPVNLSLHTQRGSSGSAGGRASLEGRP